MVAQQIALRHPERVQSLVLGGTHSGGRRAALPGPRGHGVLPAARPDAVARRRLGHPFPTTTVRAAGPSRSTGSPRTSSAGSRNPFNEHAYRAQLLAASLHNCYRRLERIRAPTLVVHGARDRIIPVANAHMTAERMPGAQLKILNGRGPSVPHRGPGGGRGHRRVLRRAPMRPAARPARRGLIELTSVQVLDDLRVADVVREHAVEPTRRRRDPLRHARADLRRARRSLEPAGPGAAVGRRARRRSRCPPRPHRARDRRASVRRRARSGPSLSRSTGGWRRPSSRRSSPMRAAR